MGGLLAHTLVSDSGNFLWNVFANRPLDTLSLLPAERSTILQYFFSVIRIVLTGSFFWPCPIVEVGWLPALLAALVTGWFGIPESRRKR
jgi:hypothetical protein